ncbi:MAG: M23 family metallopeptidase [Acidobacteriota bacterium]|nr:M23 family metallopeptidase [Acidobacteriota bacterium]
MFFCQRNRLSRFMCPIQHLLVILLIVGATSFAIAADKGAAPSISWNPRQIKVGSPCLFKVEFAGAPSRVAAKWQGRDLVFFFTTSRHVWYGLAGVDIEAKPGNYKLELEATMADGRAVNAERKIRVLPSAYKTVRLKVPDQFVEPDAETLKRIEVDKELKKKAFAHQIPEPQWSGTFRPPLTNASATESFGVRRTFNGKLATVHRGLDYHAKEGTPVLAANSGTVVLAQALFYEGNCVIVDHGQQFMTLYIHLSQIQVAEGDKVAEGQQLGLSGATGRATGPHLHVAARWQGAYVDPAQLWALPLPRVP